MKAKPKYPLEPGEHPAEAFLIEDLEQMITHGTPLKRPPEEAISRLEQQIAYLRNEAILGLRSAESHPKNFEEIMDAVRQTKRDLRRCEKLLAAFKLQLKSKN